MNAIRKLASYSDFMQAQLIMNLLEGCGIPVLNRSDNAGGIDNGLFASNGIHLYVHEDNLIEALKIIESSNI
jgi:hypothetical protein